MDAEPMGDGEVRLVLSEAEAIALHEVLARAEWAEDLGVVEPSDPAEVEVLSRVQQALAPHIAALGTDSYNATVDEAWKRLREGT